MPGLTFPTVTYLRMLDGAERHALPYWPWGEIRYGAAETGFGQAGLDCFTVAASGGDPAELLRRYGLRCTDVGVLRIGEPAEPARSAAALRELGERTGAEFCVTAFDADPADEEVRALAAACAEEFCRAGTRLAVEFLPYTPPATLAAARELCAAIGWGRCGLLIDAWMFFRGANTWAGLAGLRAHEVVYVQLDDAPEPIGPDVVFESRHRRVLPGEGVLDLVRFTRSLDRIGFAGPVAVEVLNPRFRERRPVEQARAAAQAVWPALDEGAHA